MTAADHIGRARALIADAQAHVLAASMIVRGARPELQAEVAVLERSRGRLEVVRRRILVRGWKKFVAFVRRQNAA